MPDIGERIEGYDYEGEAEDPSSDRSGKPAQAQGMEGKEEERMNYLVRVWKDKNGKHHTELHDFSDLDEAKDYADWKAEQLKKYGYKDFGILIYEVTNY